MNSLSYPANGRVAIRRPLDKSVGIGRFGQSQDTRRAWARLSKRSFSLPRGPGAGQRISAQARDRNLSKSGYKITVKSFVFSVPIVKWAWLRFSGLFRHVAGMAYSH